MKILIVDDIFTNRLLLSEIFNDLDFVHVEAENGKEAIDILGKEDIDVVLMDIEMPVMNGLETTRHIRNTFPEPKCNMPIIALTAHNPNLFFDDFKDVGFTDLITKPYSIEKITKVIKSLFT
ncbi:MAG: response regulator [Bacteroidota bacterium]